jgi:hypothetical protein
MEAADNSDMSVNLYPTVQRNSLEDGRSHTCLDENVIPYMCKAFLLMQWQN